jgi:integrase
VDYWIRQRKTKISITVRDRESGRSSTLSHPTLDTINTQLTSRAITPTTAHKLAQELIAQLRPKTQRIFHDDNRRVFEDYMRDVMDLRDNRDPVAARNRIVRGLNALGNTSIHVAPKVELLRAVQDAPNRREAIAVINQLLKFLGRPISLPAARPKPISVNYLTWNQFENVLKMVQEPPLRVLFSVLFCTGCRVGEAFAIDRTVDAAGRIVFVRDQVLRNGKRGILKNATAVPERRVIVLGEGVEAVREWIAMGKDRESLRRVRISDVLREACRRAGVPSLAAKDLRHCYAVYWATKGVGVAHIARLLGNSEHVCNKYYTGFVVSDVTIDALLAL